MQMIKGPSNKNVTQVARELGIPIDDPKMWKDEFWFNPIQEICVRILPKGMCNIGMGMYGNDSPIDLITYVIDTMHRNEMSQP